MLKLRSYAKINWTLDVLHRRDDGYHEIRTIYQTVSLYDTVRISATDGAIQVVCDHAAVACDETNLAYRAAVLARQAGRVEKGARIEITKRTPVGGGLGGGSSNAAAVLLGLNRVWGLGLDFRHLVGLAAEMGSDVPFFLVGGTALGMGRGEEVYPLEEQRCDKLVLANPGISVSTGEAYARLCRLTSSETARMIPITLLAANGIREHPLQVTNDLEEVVFDSYPEIGEVKRSLTRLGAQQALMSGSGATVFGVFDKVEQCRRAVTELKNSGLWAGHVRTVNRLEYLETMFETGE